MRGPPRISQRSGYHPRPVNEADAMTYSLPAPYGGWNARGNLANMAPLDAVVMDNVFPGVQEVSLRKGRINWVTGFAADIKSLLAYNGPSATKLFASTNTGIYDVTTSGAVGAAVTACTNGRWESVNFSNSGGSFMVSVNGVDKLKLYDGASWTDIDGVSVPAITGVTTSSLVYVSLHKKRLWFIENNSMKLWYMPVDSIGGAATLFPVGSLFRKGGKLVATGSWTLDGGNGADDYFVMCTSNGEIAVYQGTDPASSTTWALVGVYDVGQPMGNKPFVDYGGDLLYISRNGLFPLSKLVQSTVVDRSQTVSFKIDGAFLDATTDYAANFGWQAVIHQSANFLLVNVPVSNDTLSYQFVMNTISKSWCRFTNWNATAWAVLGSDLYFAGGRSVSKAWVGVADAGSPITGQIMQAYNALGKNGQKDIVLVRPNIAVSGSATLQMALDSDFKTFNGSTSLLYSPVGTPALWDAALWDTGLWDAGLSTLEPKWLTVPNELGYLHSFRLQLSTSTASFTWTSTNFAYRMAGIL